MNRPKKPPRRLDVVRAYFDFARANGLPLSGPEVETEFLKYVQDVIATEGRNPIVRHGFRTEAMFSFVTKGLPGCRSITREDSASLHGSDGVQPDYRVVPVEGDEFFVEVKNHYQKKGGFEPFCMTQTYVDALVAYARAHGRDLRFAVYWTKWNIWTLVSPSALTLDRGRPALNFDRALLLNEMGSVLQDYHIGSPHPLALRFHTDPAKPRRLSKSGKGVATVQRSAVCVNGEEIQRDDERRLAAFFMFYGDWSEIEQPCHVENGEVQWFEFSLKPEEPQSPPGNIELIGTWSGMASRRYRDLTRHGEQVGQVELDGDPTELCPHVPADFAGDVLQLSRVTVHPVNHDST